MATTTRFTIRVAVPGDLAALDALFARAYPRLLRDAYPPSILVTAVPRIARAQPRLLASRTFHLAEDAAGRVLGAGGWTPGRKTGQGDIRHFVTDDRATRQGIGGALLRHCIAEAARAGVNLLRCQATRNAVPFYASEGFRELGAIEVPLRPGIGFPAIAMERRG